jgi:proline dehydrogenase
MRRGSGLGSAFSSLDKDMQLLTTLMARAVPLIPRAVIQKLSRRYIAGVTIEEMVARTAQLNMQGFSATLDVLGESISTLCEAQATGAEYVRVLEAIRVHALRADISVKPTALGLLLDTAECERLLERVLESARKAGSSVCLDMEDVHCTQRVIDLFTRLRSRHDNLSLALQAYLQRSHQDIAPLLSQGASLRICKGVYLEERSHLVADAWKHRAAINPHFMKHVERCFDAGTFVAIATHDASLIDLIVERVRQKGIDTTRFEFQMLLGVCEPLRDQLLRMGFKVRIYVPYGADWYAYSVRRLKENPRIAGHVARAALGL